MEYLLQEIETIKKQSYPGSLMERLQRNGEMMTESADDIEQYEEILQRALNIASTTIEKNDAINKEILDVYNQIDAYERKLLEVDEVTRNKDAEIKYLNSRIESNEEVQKKFEARIEELNHEVARSAEQGEELMRLRTENYNLISDSLKQTNDSKDNDEKFALMEKEHQSL